MKKLITTLLVIGSSFLAKSQSSAIIFEPGTISNDGIFGLTLSPDGNNALWVSSKGKRDTLIIYESKKVDSKWQKPTMSPFSGTWRDIDPIFTPDGKTLLFQSNRPVQAFPNRKRFDMWAVSKTKNGWSEPFHLGNVINTDSSESYASATKQGTIYFTKENGKTKGDLFYSEFKNGVYQTPVGLDAINTSRRDANPFISPDEDYLIYAASKPENENDSDLFISFKKDKQWTIPQNLGIEINTLENEFCPFVHMKQNRLYFSRMRRIQSRFVENTYYLEGFSEVVKKLKKTSKLAN